MTGVLKSPIVVITYIIAVIAVIIFLAYIGVIVWANAIFIGLLKAAPALWRCLFWKRAEGEVTALCKGKGTELSSVVYRYRVAGAEYEGTANENPKWHKKWQKIDIYYKPDQPNISRYTSNISEFVIGWGFIFVGVYGLLYLGI